MKKLLYLFLIFILFSCKTKKPTTGTKNNGSTVEIATAYKRFLVTPKNEVAQEKIDKAYEIGKRLLETCNTSRFQSFNTNEATQSVIENATVEKISKTCQKINLRNGKFIDLNLLEIIHDLENDDFIFRYDIKYAKTYYKRELKIVVNKDNKVSSITSKEIQKQPF